MSIRIITATSSFDGHDAGINYVKNRLLREGAEVIHLGHNRSVEEIVNAAIQEDVDAIGISSYQGGHMEYFSYMIGLLKEKGMDSKLFIGGGATVTQEEAEELKKKGVAGVYRTGDENFTGDILSIKRNVSIPEGLVQKVKENDILAIGKAMSMAESYHEKEDESKHVKELLEGLKTEKKAKIIGVTGPGGAGKSTFADEIVKRCLNEFPDKKVGIISVDPTKRKGGALLGDRIRMNHIGSPNVFMRSVASRGSTDGIALSVEDAINILNTAGYDLVIVETVGMSQMNTRITEISDLAINVMTREYGSSLQLDKIDMINDADYNVINKIDRQGSESAFDELVDRMHINEMECGKKQKVFGTQANRYNDEGVNILFKNLIGDLGFTQKTEYKPYCSKASPIIPHKRIQYLREAVEKVRGYNSFVEEQVEIARNLSALLRIKNMKCSEDLEELIEKTQKNLHPVCRELLACWEHLENDYSKDENSFKTFSGTKLKKVELPKTSDLGERLRFLLKENVPGRFPYANGVYEFQSGKGQAPTRMFAGLRTPKVTNERFHFLSKGHEVARLSTAFDGLTLYGADPDTSKGDYGKIGESGVSVCTLDDVKKLYKGFELADGKMSVSMTINGPAPMMMAMFLNAAIDQQKEKSGKKKFKKSELEEMKTDVFQKIRGTIQADILKEDIAQNSCIFSLDFALRLMGDMQQFFIDNKITKFNSVSISGYHIAEAGANPIQQAAYTIANGLTYVEYYLSRGMQIDDIAKNLSFFFSTGLDEEYAVIGRVSRKIWAVAMRDLYGADEKSQKMRYHIQTSGRSLQEREADFNDIRTTLQALTAWADAANSLHTNSYDEAYTTPTKESVKRALAIQSIIREEFGNANLENINSGSYAVENLSEAVENAILEEMLRMDKEGGVLGAIENGYQRRMIQRESAEYQMNVSTGKKVLVGVNKYQDPEWEPKAADLIRSTEEDKQTQLRSLQEFKEKNKNKAPKALSRLKKVAADGGNVFEELMYTARYCSLGQITNALYEVGGKYRRN